MLKLLFSLYLTCYACYIFYSREPDFFDGETVAATIIIDSKTKAATAVYNIENKSYSINADYLFRHFENLQSVELIYLPQHPQKADVYSLWGYWFRWGELLMSSILLLAMFQLAVSITKNPTALALANQQETDEIPKRKYED